MSVLKTKQIHSLDLSGYTVEKTSSGLLFKSSEAEIEVLLEGPKQEAALVSALFGADLLLDPNQIASVLNCPYASAVNLFKNGEIQDFSSNSYKKGSVLQVLRLKAGQDGLTEQERAEWEKQAEEEQAES